MKKHSHEFTRRKETSSLKEVFEELLEAYRLKDKFSEKTVVQEWGLLMGKTVAMRTQSLSVRQKTLYVKITSGPLKKELMMNKSKVLALIADKYGKDVIKDIVIL